MPEHLDAQNHIGSDLVWLLEGSAPSWVRFQLGRWWAQKNMCINIAVFESGVEDMRGDRKVAIAKFNDTCPIFDMGAKRRHEMASGTPVKIGCGELEVVDPSPESLNQQGRPVELVHSSAAD